MTRRSKLSRTRSLCTRIFTHEHQHDEPLSDEGTAEVTRREIERLKPNLKSANRNRTLPPHKTLASSILRRNIRALATNATNATIAAADKTSRGDSGGDRGEDVFGRRGGRRRGGRPQGGRNLPPSKYASPQGDQRPHDSRGSYESRGPQQGRGFEPRGEHRRPEGSRFSPPAAPPAGSAEDEIVLPGESLAKYRNKPAAAASAPAVVEPEIHEPQPTMMTPFLPVATCNRVGRGLRPVAMFRAAPLAVATLAARRIGQRSRDVIDWNGRIDFLRRRYGHNSAASSRAGFGRSRTDSRDASLSEEDVAIISSSLVEAKHEETQAKVTADALVGGAVFDDEEQEEPEEEEEPKQPTRLPKKRKSTKRFMRAKGKPSPTT